MDQKQMRYIRKSLNILKKFNENKINYRIIGSVLISAINKKPHRQLGDIDVVLDKKDEKKAFKIMKESGYEKKMKKKLGFSWVEFIRKDSLIFTFLLVGKFYEEYFSYIVRKHVELRISLDYLYPYYYKLFGIKFVGISPESIYSGIRISNFNPKRKLDKRILLKIIPKNNFKNMSILKSFKVFVFGLHIPALYLIFSYIYNIYGGIRVIFGKKYEIWG